MYIYIYIYIYIYNIQTYIEKTLTVYCKLYFVVIFSMQQYLRAYYVYGKLFLLVCSRFHLIFSGTYIGLSGYYLKDFNCLLENTLLM